ncbi:P-loop containing nucleoside triphosphate hydrolase protein [Podospora aff. communis PSN243]|uniref:P-loop containing nucleoside triphosphate hydrolase protein n=1 Tax=Podospora aff. communis PSN243 TaxID=3040156 RepID=A0AAV9GG29_9PEZI|nr:P-loop containing nucleoside triphosphate hydrolase protein [Podospora aff. communis PSN243]
MAGKRLAVSKHNPMIQPPTAWPPCGDFPDRYSSWDRGRQEQTSLEAVGQRCAKENIPPQCCLVIALQAFPKGGFIVQELSVTVHLAPFSHGWRFDLRRRFHHPTFPPYEWVELYVFNCQLFSIYQAQSASFGQAAVKRITLFDYWPRINKNSAATQSEAEAGTGDDLEHDWVVSPSDQATTDDGSTREPAPAADDEDSEAECTADEEDSDEGGDANHDQPDEHDDDAGDDDGWGGPCDYYFPQPGTQRQMQQHLDLDDSQRHTAEYRYLKRREKRGNDNAGLDMLMALTGIEHVKHLFLDLMDKIDITKVRKGRARRAEFNIAITGNPGTGKTTTLKIYKTLMAQSGIWEATEYGLASLDNNFHPPRDDDPGQCVRIEQMEEMGDEALPRFYSIVCRNPIYNMFHVSGKPGELHKFIDSRPEGNRIHHANVTVHGGEDNPGYKVLLRRLSNARDKGDGFGNVHTVQQEFEAVLARQAIRLRLEGAMDADVYNASCPKRKPLAEAEADKDTQGVPLPETILQTEDFIGPEPVDIRPASKAWAQISGMVGMEEVKKALDQLLDLAKTNYRREIAGLKPIAMTLNRVFIGPPGTGKTTAARLYAQLIAEAGLLSSDGVVYTTPDDYIGCWLGESEVKTHNILSSSQGKVLIVDDAHSFWQGERSGTPGGCVDSYRLGVVDTFVSLIHNKPGEDRCVILLGYPDEMEDMFRNVNPGLRRRFPLESAFRFDNYSDAHLLEILQQKMANESFTADKAAMGVAAEVLRRLRDRPNFGNGGDVENLLSEAKCNARTRMQKAANSSSSSNMAGDAVVSLTREDFDPEWDRGATATIKCRKLFEGLVGFDTIINRFVGYQRLAQNLRRRGKDPRQTIPFSFIFKGPPGTGKTHTARILGQVFFDMGFLSTAEVIECSASDLIGQYLGSTGPKVLFVDEAYRLLGDERGERSYEAQAVGEIVNCMTRTQHLNKMVVVLAGYDHDMDQLMKCNSGLRSRFTTDIHFAPMSADASWDLLVQLLLEMDDIVLSDAPTVDGDAQKRKFLGLFRQLTCTPGWANARDLQNLAKRMLELVYSGDIGDVEDEGVQLFISAKDIVGAVDEMLRDRDIG